MERDGQHRVGLGSQQPDLRHHARGRDSDAPSGKLQAFLIGQHADGLTQVIKIIQGLAHAHEDDIGDKAAVASGHKSPVRCGAPRIIVQTIPGDQHLGDDFRRREIAHQLLRAGVAEGAIQCAADLAGDTQRAPLALGNINAFHLCSTIEPAGRSEPDQPFAGAILADLLADNPGALQRIGFSQPLAQRFRDSGHIIEIRRAAHIDPMPELRHPHSLFLVWHADVRESFRQSCTAQACDGDTAVDLGHSMALLGHSIGGKLQGLIVVERPGHRGRLAQNTAIRICLMSIPSEPAPEPGQSRSARSDPLCRCRAAMCL